jgi:hypothetical protein
MGGFASASAWGPRNIGCGVTRKLDRSYTRGVFERKQLCHFVQAKAEALGRPSASAISVAAL